MSGEKMDMNNYVNGVIEGRGIFKYGNKAIYKGEFRNGVKEGNGELITKNNRIIGIFKNNLPHGKGYLEDNKGFKGYVEFNEGKIIEIKNEVSNNNNNNNENYN